MSASTNERPWRDATPRFGVSVVKWYAAIFGRAAVSTDNMVDLPTDGRPMSPTSAMVLSSSSTSRSAVRTPFCAKRGACRVGVAKRALPLPPRPPRSTVRVLPGSLMSARIAPVSTSRTSVPTGTRMTSGAPSRPARRSGWPGPPFSAR